MISRLLLILLCGCTLAGPVAAGSLDAPAAPSAPGSAMYTLQSLCDRLVIGAVGTKRGAAFAEPTAGPTATMCTLNDIMSRMPAVDPTGATVADVRSGKTFWGLTAGAWGLRTGSMSGSAATSVLFPLAKTGQTTSYAAGDDGALQKGVAWPSPRFTDHGDGTVTDNLTGLNWLKHASCGAGFTWLAAQAFAAGLSPAAPNWCNLATTDRGEWRLPSLKELNSLLDASIDTSGGTVALPAGHPFQYVDSNYLYWSSTSYAGDTSKAWALDLKHGSFYWYFRDKTDSHLVWPVRGGQ